jgi:hypothetical protein
MDIRPNYNGLDTSMRLRPVGGVAIRIAQYGSDPVRGTSNLLWEDAVPEWGRVMRRGCPGGLREGEGVAGMHMARELT